MKYSIKQYVTAASTACLLLSLVSCSNDSGGGPKPPPPSTPSVSVSIAANTLLVPSSEENHQVTESAPTSTEMTITGKNVSDDITVAINDQRTDSNKLSVSPTECQLTTQTNKCTIKVSAVAGDKGQDTLSILATDTQSKKAVTVTPSTETIQFDSSPQPQGVKYTLDATHVGGDAAHSVAYITAINKVTYPDPSRYFEIKGGALYGKGSPPAGIYQINIKATKDSEVAYSTFYLNVAADGSLSKWQQSASQKNNVVKIGGKPLTMVYTYTHSDPSKEGPARDQFMQDYSDYATTLNTKNTTVLSSTAPINAVAVEMAGPAYTQDNIDWRLDPSVTDIKQQVSDSASALANGFSDLTWMPALVKTLQDKSATLTLAPDLTFGQNVRADYSTYDAEQLAIVSNEMMKFALNSDKSSVRPDVTGISFDLEKGTGNDDARAFKSFADHLAYHGLFFGYYEFADKSFQPSIVAAMGPLGVAFVSSYDVGGDRASSEQYNGAYSGGSSHFGSWLYGHIFANNFSCNIHDSTTDVPDPMKRASWCNLSTNDSFAANQQAWSIIKNPHGISTQQTMDDFNGNYSVTLPIGESSTDFSDLELFNPDFSKLVGNQAGLVMTNEGPDATKSACASLSQNHPENFTTANLDKCVFADVQFKDASGEPHAFSQYTSCGKDADGQEIPLSKCILISSNLSAVDGELKNPTQADYMNENLKAYQTNDSHMVGYSLFALQNTASAPSNGNFLGSDKTNLAIQQPWFIGGDSNHKACKQNDDAPCDPFYGSAAWQKIVTGTWLEFAKIQLPA